MKRSTEEIREYVETALRRVFGLKPKSKAWAEFGEAIEALGFALVAVAEELERMRINVEEFKAGTAPSGAEGESRATGSEEASHED